MAEMDEVNDLKIRVTVLEQGLGAVKGDITEMKGDMKEIKKDITAGFDKISGRQDTVTERQEKNKKWAIGTFLATAIGLLGIIVTVIAILNK